LPSLSIEKPLLDAVQCPYLNGGGTAMEDMNKTAQAAWNSFLRSGDPKAYLRYVGALGSAGLGAMEDCNKTSWPL
jgi:hypothetical protein